MNINSKILILGANGMVGSALYRKLQSKSYNNILVPSRKELDLLNAAKVKSYFKTNRPEYVFFAAAKQGGIYANDHYRADFLFENMALQVNVLSAAFLYEVRRLMFFACSCIYPKNCPQPMKEEYILSGNLENTSEAFAVAKIAGLKLCDAYNFQYGTDFLTVIPTNLYGQNQNYEQMNSLVVPALIRTFHEAKIQKRPDVKLWGTGKPVRDFLFVDDLAEASLILMTGKNTKYTSINVASGKGISIRELAGKVRDITGYQGVITFDCSMPDGTTERISDISKISSLGWKPSENLMEGLKISYQDFLNNLKHYL